ncbi:pro-neuregulin-3, membrane-bound isoform [Pleuronectes platessa]|uniref:pro-neuregulin-3, membrane-bound isoform n=1 Tax=Pleuronectes platessa TaxID=8262 RepID=UPI00232A2E1B|nr:pro-neuregulin-3, membrane-bound isoform [Pleuronectes platessa]
MSHKGRQGRMSECSGAAVSGVVILEEPEVSGATGGRREGQAQDQGPLRCAVWPRQQTWLCVVPLLIGFIGLGLSLMLLKWIVVGTVRDYVPTDLVDANRIGQDPIFLSKPSGIPKGPDTTTTTITPTAEGGNPTARTVTGRARSTATTTTINPRGGGASGSQVTPRNPGNRNGRGPSGFTTTTAAPRTTFIIGAATSSPSPSNPTVLHDSTQMWTPEHTTTETASTTLTTRTHGHRKAPSPTVPPLHSEHFKPCHEKDLAYCLNGGECFVIETLSGPHKHCNCKTSTGLSPRAQFSAVAVRGPESKEVYKRQVLSLTCIAMTISLLGTLCMALYCRNKRRREKLQAHLKESRSLKNYSANSHNPLEVKLRTQSTNLQMHEFCKRSSPPRQGNVSESSFAHCNSTAATAGAASSISRGTAKHHSPDQKTRTAHWSASRRTPPIPRGRLNPMGVSKFSGPAYQHLQEVDSTEKEAEAQRRCQTQGGNPGDDPRRDALLHMQAPVLMETTSLSPWSGGSAVRSGPCAPSEYTDSSPATRSLRRPGRRQGHSPPPPFRSCSIPIIPSVQCHHDSEVSCMQTSVPPGTAAKSVPCGATPCKDERRGRSSSSCSPVIGQQQDEVALLLEEAQEQLWALAQAHRKQEEGGVISGGMAAAPVEARETVCFLNLIGGGAGVLSCNGPTQTQLLSPSLSHRDLGHAGQ